MKKSNELKELEKLAGGLDIEKKKLLEIFIRQVSTQIEQMNSCLQSNDWKELKRIAHSMKSAFLHIKMKRPIELTELIRTTAGLNAKTTKQQINELEEICSHLINEFAHELKTEF